MVLKSARGLRGADASGTSDPYAILVLEDGVNQYREKTSVVNRCNNPIWGQTFSFLVHHIEYATLTISIYDKDYDHKKEEETGGFSRDDFLGTVTLKVKDLVENKLDPEGIPLDKTGQFYSTLSVFAALEVYEQK